MDSEDKNEAERLSAVVLNSLDAESGTPADLARRAYRSRTQFYRLFQALIEENPGTMRRRLLLERAVWQLGRTRRSVTDIALDADYGSLEAFTRAFRKAFQVSPSLYRRMGASNICLPAPNGIHFAAPGAESKKDPKSKGATNMDLFDLFAGTDSWYTRRLLEHASALSDEQLDRPQNATQTVFGWGKPDSNLRETLERMVETKEVWVAALSGGAMPNLGGPPSERTPAALLRRFEKAEADFQRILGDVRARNAWSDTFVDALCEPAETFTFGGMFADVVTFNAVRRLAALDAFQRLGVPIQGSGSPIEYEASIAGRLD
jgi:AraC family transcriptional regulator